MNYRFDIFNFVGYFSGILFLSVLFFFLFKNQKSKFLYDSKFLMKVICVTFGRKLTKLVFHFIQRRIR